MSRKRTLLIIDGNNFYNRKKELDLRQHKLTEFNYFKLAEWIAEGDEVILRNYYIGVVKAQKNDVHGQKLRIKQQQLFSHLESERQSFNVIRGMLMSGAGGYREKGVDVRMAVDIVVGALEDTYDSLIIISSDTDLIPAIKLAREKNKSVTYIGFSHKPSLGMQNNVDFSRLLTKKELEQFIDN